MGKGEEQKEEHNIQGKKNMRGDTYVRTKVFPKKNEERKLMDLHINTEGERGELAKR